MKVAVTGGSGFIGSYVVEDLYFRYDHEVVVFDLHGELHPDTIDEVVLALESGFVSVVKGDVRDEAAVNELAARVDGIIHLASAPEETASGDPRLAFETDIQGSLNVFKAACEHDVPVVYVSGLGRHRTLGKATAEEYAHQFNGQGGRIAIVRPGTVYGDRQPLTSDAAIPSFIRRALDGQPIPLPGGGHQIGDWVFVEDVAHVLDQTMGHLLELVTPPEWPVEIGTTEQRSLHDLAYLVAEMVALEKGTPEPLVPHERVAIDYLPAQGDAPDAQQADTETLWQVGVHPESLSSLGSGLALTISNYAHEWLALNGEQ